MTCNERSRQDNLNGLATYAYHCVLNNISEEHFRWYANELGLNLANFQINNILEAAYSLKIALHGE